MAAIDDKITKLETQLKQAKAQRQKVEARKRAATSKMTRQQDTRKKSSLVPPSSPKWSAASGRKKSCSPCWKPR